MYDKIDEVELSKLLSENVNRKENTNFINDGFPESCHCCINLFTPDPWYCVGEVGGGGGGGEDGSFLTSFPQASVGYEIQTELVIIISFPTSASGIIEMWKTPQNIDKSS